MIRTVIHVEDEETQDSSSPSENRGAVNRKGNVSRSKHSEAEQRRRNKINERFQILRNLIPENDHKPDKASLLLEAIQHIQFLQEKLRMYEGPCQGWSPELTKLTPRRVNSGSIPSFIDQSQLERQLSGQEENVLLNPTFLSDVQNPVVSDLPAASSYKPTHNPAMATNQTLPLNMPLQPPVFEGMTGELRQGSFPDELPKQLGSHFWEGRSCMDDCSVPIDPLNEKALKSDSEEASVSGAYSQGLLNSLINALHSAAVDLSQANISVQLDIGKRKNIEGPQTIFNIKDLENPAGLSSLAPGSISENNERIPQKRFKGSQS